MAIVPFAEFRPDLVDFKSAGQYTDNIVNALPRGDGYGPVASLQSYATALSTPCRGFFFGRKNDGTVAVFAGTSTKLWLLDNTTLTFTDVSQGSSAYSGLGSDAHWQFEQFNKYIVAVQQNVPPQFYSLTSSTDFQDLAGSPPQAAYVTTVNRFLILSGIIAPNSYRIQWSGLNDINSSSAWTSGINSSDFQDFADGGIVRGVAGGEYGVIVQDAAIRRMTYAPGSPYVFGIDKISQDDGIYAPYSLVNAGDRVFFIANSGFKMIVPGGLPTPIGKERVDRFFFSDVDTGNIQMVIGAHDPTQTRVYWAYKSINGGTGQFDKALVYDFALDKWSLLEFSGEFLASLSKPGITLESVDTVFGSNIDTLTISSLDDITTASVANPAAIDTNHRLGFFTGPNLQATLETGEQGAEDSKRIYVNSVRPLTDASNLTVSIGYRSTPSSTRSYTTGTAPDNDTGQCPQRIDTRYATAKMVITAGSTWTFAAAVEPDVQTTGTR